MILILIIFLCILLYPLKFNYKYKFLFAALSVGLVLGMYYHLGAYKTIQLEKAKALRKTKALEILKKVKDPNEIIEKFKLYLQNHPQDAKGEFLLGKLYFSQKNFLMAVKSFTMAYKIDPSNMQYAIYMIQADLALKGYPLENKNLQILLNIIKKLPMQADTQAMLAMHYYKIGDYDEAILYWQHLLKQMPVDSQEYNLVKKAILKARKKHKEE